MESHIQKTVSEEKGFTLVELAIVMVIIGLLVGGILKGQEMIANAQVTSTVASLKAVDAATSTFRDMFDAFPGDMANAATRLANCAGACAPAAADGDSRLEIVPLAATDAESQAFFLQLQAADLVTNINNANFMDADISGTEFRPGFTAGGALGLLVNARSGHYLSVVTAGTDNGVGLTALEAARMDRKLDDGDPTTGAAGASGAATCGAAGAYAEAQQGQNCAFLLRIQG